MTIVNDAFASAVAVVGNGPDSEGPIDMTGCGTEVGEVFFAGVVGTAWYYWDSGATPQGEMHVSADGFTSFHHTIRVFTQGGVGLAGLVEVEAYRGNQNAAADVISHAYFLTAPSTRYYFQLGAYTNVTDAILNWDSNVPPVAPDNDAFASRATLYANDPPTIASSLKTLTQATNETDEDTDYGLRSVWYNIDSAHDEAVNQVIHLATDSLGDESGLGAVDDHTLRLYWNADGTIAGLLRVANNDDNLNGGATEIGSKTKWKQDSNFAPFNALVARVAVRGEGYQVALNTWTAPEAANNEPLAAIALIDLLTLDSDTTNATLTPGELDDLELDDPTSPHQGSLWFSWTAESTDDVTFTYTHDGSLHATALTRLKIWTGEPTAIDPLSEVLPNALLGLTELEDSGDGAPLSTVTITAPTVDQTYFIQALSTLDIDHTITWDVAGGIPPTEDPDPDATGGLAGTAAVQMILRSAASLDVLGTVATSHPIRVRPMMGIEINMPEPAVIGGKPILPAYWAKPASSMSANYGPTDIHVVPDADPASGPGGATVVDNWPAGGKPDYWWTVRDLTDPGAGAYTLLGTWNEHFGGPAFHSSGIYRPRLQHRDHFGAGGRKHTYTKAVVFEPDQVDHMWVDLGSNMAQPYTVMMAGIILSYPKRTYGHYLLDAGKATPAKDVNKDWTIADGLSYRSLMLFQLHSALICTRADTADGVIARVPHNYRLTPRVFMGQFNGSNSRVGYYDTREKKVSRGRTDNRSVRKLVVGRRTNKISDNLASHMVLFEIRIWKDALTLAQMRAQYKQMAALYKFNLYDKDGV